MAKRNYLVAGLSGAGKSSVYEELIRRGYEAISTDRAWKYHADPDTCLPGRPNHHDNSMWGIEEDGETAIIREERIIQARTPARQASELTVGAMHRTLCSLLGSAWKPERVCFSHAPPATRAAHVRFFGCPVDFKCDVNGIVFASKSLEARLPKGDPTMARYAQKYLDSILEHPHASTADKVRQFVRALLPSGRCSIEQVAQHLGMDRRTVHRHFTSDAETFSSIVDAVRVELATRYLTTTDRPLAEVADLLGFSGLSALSRWFSGRFDCSASAWRAAQRGRMVPAR